MHPAYVRAYDEDIIHQRASPGDIENILAQARRSDRHDGVETDAMTAGEWLRHSGLDDELVLPDGMLAGRDEAPALGAADGVEVASRGDEDEPQQWQGDMNFLW